MQKMIVITALSIASAISLAGCGSSATSAASTPKVAVSAAAGKTGAAHPKGRYGARAGGSFGFGGGSGVQTAIAQYLGVSAATLRADQARGESLTTIVQKAAATNAKLSVAGLEAVISSAISQGWTKAESSGHLTVSRIASLKQNLPQMVNRMLTMVPGSHPYSHSVAPSGQ